MLKHGAFILLPSICKLFNLILDSGKFPSAWNIIYQVPIFKSGDPTDCNNFRGIAINSCLCKVFTNVLQIRLLSFLSENNLLSENQAAAQPGKSTSDHIFTIKSVINRYLTLYKKDVYCCFVDFAKAYDSVWRDGLFLKLLRSGINGKYYNIIKNMYSNTISSIKLPGGQTEFFKTNVGIRQGDGLSPLLFCLYIDDMANIFDSSCDPCFIHNKKISHLLYADDLIIFSETQVGLQNAMNKLDIFCKKWKLQINNKKTKVLVFRQCGRKSNKTFYLNNEELETVTTFKYLGITISASGSFTQGVEELSKKGKKAWFSLRSNIKIDLLNNPKLYLKLVNSMINPILTYGAEIWCQQYHKLFSKIDFMRMDSLPFERTHNKICKQLLGVKKNVSNIAANLELGTSPLSVFIIKKMLNYWVKLELSPVDSLLRVCLDSEKELCIDKKCNSWFTTISHILSRFKTGNIPNTSNSLKMFTKNIINNILKQHEDNLHNWLESTRINGEGNKMRTYVKFKNNLGMEKYLMSNLNWKQKQILSKFRLSSHNLFIETGRHCRPVLPAAERICKKCSLNETEDELHFLLKCQNYVELRTKYIFDLNDRSVDEHFIYLMSSESYTILQNVSSFLIEAFEKRNSSEK